jgi:putative transposase
LPPRTDQRHRHGADRRGLAAFICRVHFMRNVLARVSKGSAEMVAAAIRTIFA